MESLRVPPPDPNTPPHESRLARLGVTVLVFGMVVFIIGAFPQLINLELTSGIGILQIMVMLVGIFFLTFGGYIYAYATRQRGRPPRLRERIGLRLMLTGYLFCGAAGLADVLGFGSHSGPETPPFLGPVQGIAMLVGLVVIIIGIALYAGRYSPAITEEEEAERQRLVNTDRIQLDDIPPEQKTDDPQPGGQ